MMFVDASIMVAILLQEPIWERATDRLADGSAPLFTNVIAAWEAVSAVHSRRGGPLSLREDQVGALLRTSRVEVLAVMPADLALALSAFDLYGRHRYPDPRDRNKGFDLADCFHYATAKARRLPLFTLDAGFLATDLEIVGVA